MSETASSYLVAQSASGGKFWEMRVVDEQLHIRYGKVGQQKDWTVKSFASHALAMKEGIKKMNAKLKKGYEEAQGGSGDSGEVTAIAPKTFEELMGDVRSLTEGRASSASAKHIKKVYDKMHALSPERTAEELNPYLAEKLEGWPDAYFGVKVKQRGVKQAWPKEAAPLLDDRALERAPFARFTRELHHTYNGSYVGGDDVELSDAQQDNWVRPPFSVRTLLATESSKNLTRLTFNYDRLSEVQEYGCPVTTQDLLTVLKARPALKHLSVSYSLSAADFLTALASDEEVQARLVTFELERGLLNLSVEDVERLGERGLLEGLERLHLPAHRLNPSQLVPALLAHAPALKSLTFGGTNGIDAQLGEALMGAEQVKGLEEFGVYEGNILEQGVLESMASNSKLKLKKFFVGGALRPENLDELEGLERVFFKQLMVHLSWAWDDEQKARLEEIASAKKFKVKPWSYDY